MSRWTGPEKLSQGQNVMSKPPVVRMHGVDANTPAGRHLANRYAGLINQFHMGQAQKYALSEVPLQRGYTDLGDVKMRYVNLSGQEIIDVQISPEIILQAEQEVPYVNYPIWALLELTIPRMVQTKSEMTLDIVEPAPDPEAEGDPVDIDDGSSETVPTIEEFSGSSTEYYSWRIDLRPFAGKGQIVLELAGLIEPFEPVVGSEIVASVGRRSPIESPVTTDTYSSEEYRYRQQDLDYTWAEIEDIFPELEDYVEETLSGYNDPGEFEFDTDWGIDAVQDWNSVDRTPPSDPTDLNPAVLMALFDGAYQVTDVEFWGDDSIFIKQRVTTGNRYQINSGAFFAAASIATPPPVTADNTYYRFEMFDITEYFAPIYGAETYEDRDATLDIAFFYADQLTAVTVHDNDNEQVNWTRYRWENTTNYPERWAFTRLTDLTIPGADDAEVLGRVTLDLTGGSARWEAV